MTNKYQQFLKQEESTQSLLIEAIEDGSNDSLIQNTQNQLVQIKKDRAVFEEYLRENYTKFKRLATSSSSNTFDQNIKKRDCECHRTGRQAEYIQCNWRPSVDRHRDRDLPDTP